MTAEPAKMMCRIRKHSRVFEKYDFELGPELNFKATLIEKPASDQ